MFLFTLLALALLVVFLIFIGRQSGSIKRGRNSQKKFWSDANSDLSLGATDVPLTLPGSIHEAIHQNAPVVNYATDNMVSDLSTGLVDNSSNVYSTGGELGTAIADAINEGGNSFGAFDSGSSDFDGGSTSDGSCN